MSEGRSRSARSATAARVRVHPPGAGTRSSHDAAARLEQRPRVELGLDAAHEERAGYVAIAPRGHPRAQRLRAALDASAAAADTRGREQRIGRGDLALVVAL